MNKTHLVFLSVILMLIGCTKEKESYDSIEAISIEVNFEFEIRETNDFLLGSISDVKWIDNKILIADRTLKKIHLFDSNGNFIESKLQEGSGPGEVRQLSQYIAVNKSKILIHDFSQRRFSVFELRENELFHQYDVNTSYFPSKYHLLNNDEILLVSSSSPSEETKLDITSILSREGNIIRDSLFVYSSSKSITILNPSGLPVVSTSTPDHERNIYFFNNENMFYANSKKVGFSIFDINSGSEIFSKEINLPQIEKPTYENTDFVDSFIESMGMGKDQRSRLISEMPDTKSLVSTLFHDNKGHVWIKLLNNEEINWLVFSKDGELVGNFKPEFEGNIINIQNGKIFVKTENEDGSEKLSVYRYLL